MSRAWGLLALLGVPGLLILAAVLGSPSEKRPARPSRFSLGGCIVVVLFSPLVLLQALIAVMSVVVVPIVGTVFLHTWPFWQDERTGKAFPFLAVLLVHPFSAVIALFGVARLLAVVDLVRDRIRKPVPPAPPPVEVE